MQASPLTQDSRPESFQPKIVQLYETLFKPGSEDLPSQSEGFWQEFFLLPPDKPRLHDILDGLTADDLLHLQVHSQQLFFRAVREVQSGELPRRWNALEVGLANPHLGPKTDREFKTLTALLGSVLTKKYTNPSSDVISVLAGLDEVDRVISEFVSAIDGIVRSGESLGLRKKAINAALSMTCGAYQTGLVSYFTHRDLFPSLMKFVHDCDTPEQVFEPFVLLGLLANYNKFELQNPYQLRLDDFVNESTIQKIVQGIGATCAAVRNGYVAVQEDLPEGWNLNSTLVFFGLRVLAPGAKNTPAPPSEEEAKELFAILPDPEAAILLSTYDFAHANKLFCHILISLPSEKKHVETAFGSALSLTSYLLQHAHRSSRGSQYAELNLMTLRILVEDPVLCKLLCSDETKRPVRLCRQRQPYLPIVNGDRNLATVILDITIDAMNHNLRRRLDVNVYILSIGIAIRLISHLSRSKIRLLYHWSELWRALLSLIRFLTTYATDLSNLLGISNLISSLVNLIALALSAGDSFLPDPASYDDLFYKLVETGPVLSTFRDAYKLSSPSSTETHSIDILISVSSHYHDILKESKGKGKKNLSPREVHQVIKQGYETLSIQGKEGLDSWEKYREADEKAKLKRIARLAVEDARRLVREN